ncbi:D-erythrose 4-phosphate dehydrogenase [Chromohalobacter canadensis]|uniref:D-erythrose 4-phosphate dehydrogenase n=1 Tax=Chromohalobacter canadensis TaxID=141389 RepID=A0A285VI10_9GAMM|nr:glyceraldehyde 3-phosphate dehydrogenase NAD-binding domain-containing protein [Chromohalobacter canadensis]SOC52181.1 D-erythrose 4-phosphate dehydrogenase [Chromohalobacter canadensis]
MALRIAINGYGRIGQCVLRALVERDMPELEVVALNELSGLDTIAYLTRFDTTHGRFPGSVEVDGEHLVIDGRPIRVLSEADPAALPWAELEIDLVLECSGSFKDRATAEDDVDATIVHGINDAELRADMRIVSAASCTTNCLVPLLTVIDEALGLEHGVTTTIHSAMNDQPVIDAYHKTDLRLTRSAMHSIIPVDTGLARGIERLMPHLAGRFECLHVRVPTINVSAMDMALSVREATSAEQVNALLQAASHERLNGLLGHTQEPVTSVDFNHDPRSGIVDATQTRVAGSHLIKMLCWFDNEWGFANRMLDVATHWLALATQTTPATPTCTAPSTSSLSSDIPSPK